MKEQALSIVKSASNPQKAKNELREFLQHLILRKMFELNLNQALVFHGETALRIIHGLARFSEDLDFHTRGTNYEINFESMITQIQRDLGRNGYNVSSKVKTLRTVNSAFIRFSRLLYESGLSPLQDENLSIKIEIDTNPTSGFDIDRSMVNQYFPISIIHHDQASFIAGKCHAILQRQYSKGRDFYDLMFYLSRWKTIEPNFVYLNNCLVQSGYGGESFSSNNWRKLLLNRLRSINWQLVKEDVSPFIGSNSDLQLLALDTFRQLLSK